MSHPYSKFFKAEIKIQSPHQASKAWGRPPSFALLSPSVFQPCWLCCSLSNPFLALEHSCLPLGSILSVFIMALFLASVGPPLTSFSKIAATTASPPPDQSPYPPWLFHVPSNLLLYYIWICLSIYFWGLDIFCLIHRCISQCLKWCLLGSQ